VRPNLQYLLDALSIPALLHNRRLDILAANRLGRALHPGMFTDPTSPMNAARFLFLEPQARALYVEWEMVAAGMVALLRAESVRIPHDQVLFELIGELSRRSKPFRTWWATHNVGFHGNPSPVTYRHPIVGELTLTFEALDLVVDKGTSVSVYTPEPGSKSERSLALLARHASR
jgi:hypothetical protein